MDPLLQRAALALLGLALISCRPPDVVASESSSTAGGTSTSGSATPTTGPQNSLPPTPTLQSPPDGATEQPLAISLCWNPVEDPDGDKLRYRIYVDDTLLTLSFRIVVVSEIRRASPWISRIRCRTPG